MGDMALNHLYERRNSILMSLSDSKHQVYVLEHKISRLQEASRSLGSSITTLETTQGSINNLKRDAGRWQGHKESIFEDDYHSYKTEVKQFVQKTKDARETIEDDIRRYQLSLNSYEASVRNLNHRLTEIDRQISAANKR